MLPFHEIKNRLNTPAENVFVGVGAYEDQKYHTTAFTTQLHLFPLFTAVGI